MFCIRLASHPLQIDEYTSDKWASEKMRDTYHYDKPSRILESALIELDQKNQEENSKKGYLNSFKIAIREYHPLISQRVSNVAFRVDKK